MSSGPGFLQRIWYTWRSLRLPWRRHFLVGADLTGNTFWEFRDALNSNRFRRIVKYSRAAHYADVRISPQWHQWLRHTRPDAPSIQEQQYEVGRQAMMKQLAAEADARWRSTPSYLDAPNTSQPQPAIGSRSAEREEGQEKSAQGNGVASAVESSSEVSRADASTRDSQVSEQSSTRTRAENPWKQSRRGAPGEDWQPQAWTPGAAQRR